MLVSLEETLGLRSRGRATGKGLVEGDDSLHARGISSTANGLQPCLSASRVLPCSAKSIPRRIYSASRGFECAFGGWSARSEENGRGSWGTYVGRGDLYKLLGGLANCFKRSTYLRGDESRDHDCVVGVCTGVMVFAVASSEA